MIMMTLKRFRVTNFRSIMDSGWIECDDVTSLVGVNEAGKSNVILALWKLKPVRDGGIDALHDMPTKKYAAWRASPEKITFISADFELDGTLVDKVAKLCDCDRAAVSVVNIKRRYDGKYVVSFPNYQKATDIKSSSVAGTVLDARDQLMLLSEKTKAETGIKEKVMNLYDEILSLLEGKEFLSLSDYETITELYPSNLVKSATSEIYPHYTATKNTIEKAFQILHQHLNELIGHHEGKHQPGNRQDDRFGELPYHGKDPGVPCRRGHSYLCRNLSDLLIHTCKEPAEVSHDTLDQQPFEPFRDSVEDTLHSLLLCED